MAKNNGMDLKKTLQCTICNIEFTVEDRGRNKTCSDICRKTYNKHLRKKYLDSPKGKAWRSGYMKKYTKDPKNMARANTHVKTRRLKNQEQSAMKLLIGMGEFLFENPSHITNEKSEPDIGNKIIKSKKLQNEAVVL